MNQIDRVLADTFFFDAVDVAANRSGRLSPDQEVEFPQLAAADAPVVHVAEGPALACVSSSGHHHHLVVGGVRFPMIAEAIATFRSDTWYRIYYAQLGRAPQLLSIEVQRRQANDVSAPATT